MKGRQMNVWRSVVGGIAASLVVTGPADANPFERVCDRFNQLTGAHGTQNGSHPRLPRLSALSEQFRRAEDLGYNGSNLISQDGKLLMKQAYGYADIERAKPMTPETVFGIGSVTKQFTAAAIMKLEEMGKLRTSDKIGRFFADVPADKRNVTVHHLLTHEAGFVSEAISRNQIRRDQAARGILMSKLRSSPGEKHSYSNAGYALLAAIVEKASGTTYESFLRQQLWLPAGMQSTGYVLPKWQGATEAKGFDFSGADSAKATQGWGADGPSWAIRGAGGVLSTLTDLGRWMEALRNQKILSASSLEKLMTPYVHEGGKKPSYYAYGWVVDAAPDGSCRISHDGSGRDQFDVLRFYPGHGLVTINFLSHRRTPHIMMLDTFEPILFDRATPSLPAGVEVSAEKLRQYAGTYKLPTGHLVRIRLVDGRLMAQSSQAGAAAAFTPFAPLDASSREIAEAAQSRIIQIVDALAKSDFGPLAASLSKRISIQEEKAFWPEWWSAWEERMGRYRRAEIVGTTNKAGNLTTYVSVIFDRSSAIINVKHDPDGRVELELGTTLFPGEYVFLPQNDKSFLLYNPMFEDNVAVAFAADKMMIQRPDGMMAANKIASFTQGYTAGFRGKGR